MATYAIGDLQGCASDFQALLNQLAFQPDRDQLWLAGDLVGRGPDSLATLRLVYALRDNLKVVLGNHDLHLLAVAYGVKSAKPKDNIDNVLTAPDRSQLLDWLQQQPFLWLDEKLDFAMVHAGLYVDWTIPAAFQHAQQAQQALQTDPETVLRNMYGNGPDHWQGPADVNNSDYLRFVINVFTRMRYCTLAGHLDYQTKGSPEETQVNAANEPLLPWYALPQRQSRQQRLLFGHWSTLGHRREHNIVSLDTGCVWGGCLTSLRLDDHELSVTEQNCNMHLQPT